MPQAALQEKLDASILGRLMAEERLEELKSGLPSAQRLEVDALERGKTRKTGTPKSASKTESVADNPAVCTYPMSIWKLEGEQVLTISQTRTTSFCGTMRLELAEAELKRDEEAAAAGTDGV